MEGIYKSTTEPPTPFSGRTCHFPVLQHRNEFTLIPTIPAKNVLQFTMVNYGKSIVNHSKS